VLPTDTLGSVGTWWRTPGPIPPRIYLARCDRAALRRRELLIMPGRYLMTSGVQGRIKVPSERRAPDDHGGDIAVGCMSATS
jgi:hypothetical protein